MIRFIILCLSVLAYGGCELFTGIDGKRLDNFVNFDYVRERIKDSYALLAWKENKNGFNWNEVTRTMRHNVRHDMKPAEFLQVLKKTLATFKDAHITFPFIYLSKDVHGGIKTHDKTYTEDRFDGKHSGFTGVARKRIFKHYLKANKRRYSAHKVMLYGIIVPEKASPHCIGYLHIRGFDDQSNDKNIKTAQKWTDEIDTIVKEFSSTDGLVLDIRQNPGGYPANMLEILGRFAQNKKHFMSTYMKNGPKPNDFAKPHHWYVEPKGPQQYTKPIVLVTDGGTGSNGEYFTIALRKFDHVIHFGQKTKGIIGYTMIFEMPNGWIISYTTGYSVAIANNNTEITYEQDGIPPKKEMEYKNIINYPNYKEQGGKVDPMLDKAIESLLTLLYHL